MKKIFKYVIPNYYDYVPLAMPKGAEILDVQMQDGWPVIWAIIDPMAPVVIRKMRAMPTGIELPEEQGRYVGTVQVNKALVFHIFDLGEE